MDDALELLDRKIKKNYVYIQEILRLHCYSIRVNSSQKYLIPIMSKSQYQRC